MKIAFERDQMLAAVQTAAIVAPVKSPKEILHNIKLEVTSDSATVIATDMEVGIRTQVTEVETETAGTALLPVSRFLSILRESNDEKMTLQSGDGGMEIRGERAEFQLPSGNPDEFPQVAQFTEDKYHEVPARLLKELIRRTLFATDTESSRYALGGVLLEMEEDRITAVGTDGRRLAKMEGPAQSVGGHSTSDMMTIVPSRAMQLIERAITDSDAEIQLAVRSNDIIVRSPRTTIYSRLVEGRFPKWREVLPDRQETHRIDLTVGPAFSALRQAAVVASKDSRGIDFRFEEGSLILSGSTAEIGQSRVELPISYSGEPVVITLDHSYVADFLKVLDLDRSFTMDIQDADAASLFTTDDGYGYVVMPLARDGGG